MTEDHAHEQEALTRPSVRPTPPPRPQRPKPGADVVPLPLDLDGQPYEPPKWLQRVEDQSLVFAPKRLAAHVRYFTHRGLWLKALGHYTTRGVKGVIYQVVPLAAGAGKLVDCLYGFTQALDHKEAIKHAAGTTHAPRAAERYANTKAWRKRILVIAGVSLVILGLWLGLFHPYAGGVAGIGALGALWTWGNLGRRAEDAPYKLTPLVDGVPSSVVKQDVKTILAEEGYDENITVSSVVFAPDKHEYVIYVVAATDIKPELLRQLERRLQAPPNSARIVINTRNSADRAIHIRTRNPLASVPVAPWITTGTVSGWQPLDLGLSNDPSSPYRLVLVMRHLLIVGRTRSGKTTVHINNMIDRLSACRDVLPCAGSLVKSAVFDAWRSVLYRKAENVAEMEDMLLWALAQIQKRDRILKDIASDDDPTNDVDKWTPELGPAIVLILDELPELVEYDGTGAHKDDPNLLEMVKRIVRTGAGLGVSVIMGVQATGNQDWGSSVLMKQVSITIIGPCTEDDTVQLLGKAKRDQGYAPHLLRAADEHNHNDAGMAVIDGPGFGSDYVRGYAPFPVKARAMKREQEWAKLGGRPELVDDPADVIEAQEAPPAMSALDAAFRYYEASILSTAAIIEFANSRGERWTPKSLADALKAESPGVSLAPRPGHCAVKKKSLRGYYREDLTKAWRAHDGRP